MAFNFPALRESAKLLGSYLGFVLQNKVRQDDGRILDATRDHKFSRSDTQKILVRQPRDLLEAMARKMSIDSAEDLETTIKLLINSLGRILQLEQEKFKEDPGYRLKELVTRAFHSKNSLELTSIPDNRISMGGGSESLQMGYLYKFKLNYKGNALYFQLKSFQDDEINSEPTSISLELDLTQSKIPDFDLSCFRETLFPLNDLEGLSRYGLLEMIREQVVNHSQG